MISSVSSSMAQQLSYINQNTSVKNTREGSASEEAKETPAKEAAETKSNSSNKIDTYA